VAVTDPTIAAGFFEATGNFFTDLAAVKPLELLIALAFFGAYLSVRARAYFNVLRAAYPDSEFQFRKIWGAWVAAYGFNNVVPARGGDIIKLFLVRSSVPKSSYPAVASSFFVEGVFDLTIGIPVLIFAFTQGVFPQPPDIASVDSADLAWLADDASRLLFIITSIGVLLTALFAVLSSRVKLFWERVRQGVTILFDRDRYLREVWAVQFVAWLLRCACFWFMLDAFGIPPSVESVLLVLACNAVAGAIPITPGGAGVMQALTVKVFANAAPATVVAAYSVGQQIALGAFSFLLGFIALVAVFGFRSFSEVRRAGTEHRAAEKRTDVV
jgi:uncharacterized membrane protein YbhN (UPF0104 family)